MPSNNKASGSDELTRKSTAGQALYRKYRSKSFTEVVGQEHIVKTLSNAIKSGRISHAYLFTGPRGVGKTSVARIIAHEVNQLPYSDESVHLDIIEIDAASNRRIDEIRDLRERARVAPATAKYKVYIIDEVHMLTREAFNALLKTLEEPPAHCIFILATTEAHKLPETITSRTQKFEFKPISAGQAAEHLGQIAKKEHIDIEPAALELLAQFGDGSFRDSINYLDQLSASSKKITNESVRELLGIPTAVQINTLVSALASSDSQAVLTTLNQLNEQGVSPAAVAAALARDLRQKLLNEPAARWIVELLQQIIEVPASRRPADSLELALLYACARRPEASTKPAGVENNGPAPKEDNMNTPSSAPSDPQTSKPTSAARPFSLDSWEDVLDNAKQRAASLYAALRLARPTLEDGSLTLTFKYPLHQKKLNLAKNKAALAEIIEQVSGAKLQITCVVDKESGWTEPDAKTEAPSTAAPGPLNSISNIFGAAEMLEGVE